MPNIVKYRFPGVNSFSKNDGAIFKGRDLDAKKLYTQITLFKTLVLHSESGTGKSSIIRAGLLPLLEKSNSNCIAVIINLNSIVATDAVDVLTDHTIKEILKCNQAIEKAAFTLYNHSVESLWTIAKKLERNDKELLLIFDQFETLQSFSNNQVNHFKDALFNLLNNKIPSNIYEEIQTIITEKEESNEGITDAVNDEFKFLSLPSKAKIVFVIREDKLGTMSLLSDHFPDIFKNDFILPALTKQNAFDAIVEPAKADGHFESSPFAFKEEADVCQLIDIIADDQTNLVDPLQLQIVASTIERNVVIRNRKNIVTQHDIPAIGDIINDYYKDCWIRVYTKLKEKGTMLEEAAFNKKRKTIINELIVKDRRNLVHSDFLVSDEDERTDQALLDELLLEGLIRKIPSGKEIFYQLCHDRFIKPVMEDITRFEEEEKNQLKQIEDKKRIEREIDQQKKLLEERLKEEERFKEITLERNKRKKILYSSIGLFLLIGVFAFVLYHISNRNRRQLKEKQILTTLTNIRKNNPTLSFEIAQKWGLSNHGDDKYMAFLKQFDSSDYAFQLGSYPFANSVIDISQNKEFGQIEITDNYARTVWNIHTNIIEKRERLTTGYYAKKKTINGEPIFFVINDDTLELQKDNGAVIKKIISIERGDNLDISKDGKYIIWGKTIFSCLTGKPIGQLPRPILWKEPMATLLLNDSKHIAVAYSNGYKIICRIDEQHADKIRITAIYPPFGDQHNYMVTSLAVDSKDHFLVAGTRQQTIEIWKLDSLASIDSKCNAIQGEQYLNLPLYRMQKAVPYKILKGHSDDINAVSISPDDSLILSGSKDQSAILWGLQTGKKLAVLKGRNAEIIHTSFTGNGTEMVTGTKDELISIWSREKASELYKQKRLSRSTPFDYYCIGLAKDKDDDFYGKIYDTVGITALFSSTLHYIINMPMHNQYPEDRYYLESLQYALNEIDGMYKKLTEEPSFEKSISKENRRVLYKYYNGLKLVSPELLLQTEEEGTAARYERYAHHHLLSMKQLFVDTTNIKTAILHASDFAIVAQYYRDSTNNYAKSIGHLKNAIVLMDAFTKKFPDDADLNNEQLTDYSHLAITYLYAGKTDSAMHAINSLKKIRNGEGFANMRLIEAFLFQNNYADAKKLFEKTENISIWKEGKLQKNPLKNWLLPDLKKIMDKKISTPAMHSFFSFLHEN